MTKKKTDTWPPTTGDVKKDGLGNLETKKTSYGAAAEKMKNKSEKNIKTVEKEPKKTTNNIIDNNNKKGENNNNILEEKKFSKEDLKDKLGWNDNQIKSWEKKGSPSLLKDPKTGNWVYGFIADNIKKEIQKNKEREEEEKFNLLPKEEQIKTKINSIKNNPVLLNITKEKLIKELENELNKYLNTNSDLVSKESRSDFSYDLNQIEVNTKKENNTKNKTDFDILDGTGAVKINNPHKNWQEKLTSDLWDSLNEINNSNLSETEKEKLRAEAKEAYSEEIHKNTPVPISPESKGLTKEQMDRMGWNQEKRDLFEKKQSERQKFKELNQKIRDLDSKSKFWNLKNKLEIRKLKKERLELVRERKESFLENLYLNSKNKNFEKIEKHINKYNQIEKEIKDLGKITTASEKEKQLKLQREREEIEKNKKWYEKLTDKKTLLKLGIKTASAAWASTGFGLASWIVGMAGGYVGNKIGKWGGNKIAKNRLEKFKNESRNKVKEQKDNFEKNKKNFNISDFIKLTQENFDKKDKIEKTNTYIVLGTSLVSTVFFSGLSANLAHAAGIEHATGAESINERIKNTWLGQHMLTGRETVHNMSTYMFGDSSQDSNVTLKDTIPEIDGSKYNFEGNSVKELEIQNNNNIVNTQDNSLSSNTQEHTYSVKSGDNWSKILHKNFDFQSKEEFWKLIKEVNENPKLRQEIGLDLDDSGVVSDKGLDINKKLNLDKVMEYAKSKGYNISWENQQHTVITEIKQEDIHKAVKSTLSQQPDADWNSTNATTDPDNSETKILREELVKKTAQLEELLKDKADLQETLEKFQTKADDSIFEIQKKQADLNKLMKQLAQSPQDLGIKADISSDKLGPTLENNNTIHLKDGKDLTKFLNDSPKNLDIPNSLSNLKDILKTQDIFSVNNLEKYIPQLKVNNPGHSIIFEKNNIFYNIVKEDNGNITIYDDTNIPPDKFHGEVVQRIEKPSTFSKIFGFLGGSKPSTNEQIVSFLEKNISHKNT